MANIYVRSTDGDNADNGTTWALANATLAGSTADALAGDTVWVSDAHAESTAAAVTLNWAGTAASPIRVVCGDDAAEPPTSLTTTATVSTTGASNLVLSSSGDYVYYYGITFQAGSAASLAALQTGGADVFYAESCNFREITTSTASTITLNSDSAILRSCGFRFAAAAQGISVTGGRAHIVGGSLESGGTSPTSLVVQQAADTSIVFDGFDITNAGAGIDLAASTNTNVSAIFRNCRLPASWSGTLHGSTPASGSVFEMFNCDSGDTNYKYQKATQFGNISTETTLVRTGGASDGTTTISYKMVTNANAEHPMLTLDSPEIVIWNDTTGSAINVALHFLHDSATNLKDNEFWIEVMYYGTSGVPLGSFVSDGISVVATAADQADSTETWTTTGMANPNTQKASVSFTPQEKGYIHVVAKMAKASYTLYICPELDLA